MKKIFLILAVLMLAAPAFGTAVTITAAQVGTTEEVTISYGTSGGGIPRAFALDITVDAGTITDIGNFFVGECNDSNGYGIFPANFARHINADFNNWDDANYTPVADVNDLPGGTQGGIGTGGVTIEMGSLYDVSKGKGPPETSGTLCSIWVSGDCNVSLALNVGRAGVVMEDGNDANSSPHSLVLNGTTVLIVCTVPDVVDWTSALAQGAIIAADFNVGVITTNCSDSIADGNVIETDPATGVAPCFSDVNIVVSTGQPTVPDVEDMNEADAITAIGAVAYISVGTVSYECNDVEVAGEVLSQTPGTGAASCGTSVDLVISEGKPTVPSVVGDANQAAQDAINAVDYISVGTVTSDCCDTVADGNVISQSVVGEQPCGTTVDLVISTGSCVTYPPCWGWASHCKGNATDVTGGTGYINLDDFIVFRDAYLLNWRDHEPADPNNPQAGEYRPCADFDGNGIINLDDFILFRDNYLTVGAGCTPDAWPPPSTGY